MHKCVRWAATISILKNLFPPCNSFIQLTPFELLRLYLFIVVQTHTRTPPLIMVSSVEWTLSVMFSYDDLLLLHKRSTIEIIQWDVRWDEDNASVFDGDTRFVVACSLIRSTFEHSSAINGRWWALLVAYICLFTFGLCLAVALNWFEFANWFSKGERFEPNEPSSSRHPHHHHHKRQQQQLSRQVIIS